MVLNDGPDVESLGCGFSAFREIDEVTTSIAELRNTELSPRQVEKNRDRFNFVLTQYQDQPHLLDPYIDEILSSMLDIIRDDSAPENIKHNVFKHIFILMSVKMYKKIVTYLPHEVITLIFISVHRYFDFTVFKKTSI